MKLVESFADMSRFVALRRDIHAHPELGFEEHRTSATVAQLLREWGIEVHTGVAGTGVVGVLRCGDGRRAIGLRADLDALPLQEENHFPHRSQHDGRMHACGHDGHTTMLLAAAWHLSQTRDFSGTVNFIFQPAEEMGKAGALKMIEDGLFRRFPCEAVFALHNFALPTGRFAINHGALMASSNTWRVTLAGRGTHASMPHTGIDPVGATIDLAQQLQSLVPRVVNSTERALLAVTQLRGSDAPNVIPDHASVGGTVRTFSTAATDAIEADGWVELTHNLEWLMYNWDRPDEGIWETRGGRKNYTYSRLMSWVAVERAIRIARQRGLPADLPRWMGVRDAIYNQIMEHGWHPGRRAFVQHYDTDVLDASLLLMPLCKFIAPTDPRWISTLDAITEELVSDSLVYRYNVGASPDGLASEEATFSLCSFWWVEALARAGRLDEARLAFEKMLTYANHVGLYSEEIGPTGEQLGNFPQAFTHLALISAAYNLDRQLG